MLISFFQFRGTGSSERPGLLRASVSCILGKLTLCLVTKEWRKPVESNYLCLFLLSSQLAVVSLIADFVCEILISLNLMAV